MTDKLRSEAMHRLDSQLAYQPLPAICGRQVSVASVRTSHHDVLSAFRADLPEVEKALLVPPTGVFEKYGILDLKWKLRRPIPPVGAGLRILREIEVISDDPAAQELGLFDVEAVAKELSSGCFLKMILHPKEYSNAEDRIRSCLEGRMKVTWPMDFVVEDAVITNLPTIWLFRYL